MRIIQPGAAGTVAARDATNRAMGDGQGKPCQVIKEGRLLRYVGIGWVDERKATQEDAERFPVVVYPHDERPHQIRV